MKAISGKDFAKILERNGWSLLRVQGSHHVSVPIRGNRPLKTGLLRHLMKQAGVTEADL
jgi:predicted RNA binding protein YcfA (HicA-like mRNA interferase family)